MFNKVLILSASAGAGHVRAAQALERAFAETGLAQDVQHIDTLQYTTKAFRTIYAKVYFDMVKSVPDLVGWLYDQTDKPWQNERPRHVFEKLNTRRFVSRLEQYQPDITVCTHFLPASLISWLKYQGRLTARQAIVLTDFDAHALWLCHHYEHYFVALEETKVYLSTQGIRVDAIHVSGIPIDPVFLQPKDQRAMRAKYHLRQDVPTLLISAGGVGVGPMEALLHALSELQHPAQILALCGRNADLLTRARRVAAALPPHHHVGINVVPFTTAVDEYMAAADIVLGKPGGLTTAEALARGLAFVIVNPIPGQEEHNAAHLLEEGVALRCHSLPVLAYKMDRLLDDPVRFAAMQERARRMAKPHAAFDIVQRLVGMQDMPLAAVERHTSMGLPQRGAQYL